MTIQDDIRAGIFIILAVEYTFANIDICDEITEEILGWLHSKGVVVKDTSPCPCGEDLCDVERYEPLIKEG